MFGYYEEAVGSFDQPEGVVDNLSAIAMQFALGGIASSFVSPMDKKTAVIMGGIAAVAAGQVAQAIFPMGGVFYWLRNAMVPGGAGVLVGMHQQKQWEQGLMGAVAADPYLAGRLASNPQKKKPIWERSAAEQYAWIDEDIRRRKELHSSSPKCPDGYRSLSPVYPIEAEDSEQETCVRCRDGYRISCVLQK